jgi:hypothetical protein
LKNMDCIAFLQWALPQLSLSWRGFRRVRSRLTDFAAYRDHLKRDPHEWAVSWLTTFGKFAELSKLGGDIAASATAGVQSRSGEGQSLWGLLAELAFRMAGFRRSLASCGAPFLRDAPTGRCRPTRLD